MVKLWSVQQDFLAMTTGNISMCCVAGCAGTNTVPMAPTSSSVGVRRAVVDVLDWSIDSAV
ncbi:MAG: hypothetical protein AABY54_00990 [Deltaproteobacteria bacterium]